MSRGLRAWLACGLAAPAAGADWLTEPNDALHRTSTKTADGLITLSNGLIERVFTTTPAFGTLELKNLKTGQSALRQLAPEATFVANGTLVKLGGLSVAPQPTPTGPTLSGQHAYLNRSAGLAADPDAWDVVEHWTGPIEASLPWTPGRRSSPTYVSWPPAGTRLSARFAPPASAPPFLRGLNAARGATAL